MSEQTFSVRPSLLPEALLPPSSLSSPHAAAPNSSAMAMAPPRTLVPMRLLTLLLEMGWIGGTLGDPTFPRCEANVSSSTGAEPATRWVVLPARREAFEEPEDEGVDLVGLLLLDPMAGALDDQRPAVVGQPAVGD